MRWPLTLILAAALTVFAAVVGTTIPDGVTAPRRLAGSAAGNGSVATELAANKALVRRWYDDFANAGDLALADELFAPSHAEHAPSLPEPSSGPDGQRRLLLALRAGFPDLRFTVEELIAEGDRVAVRWVARGTHLGEFAGLPPTGEAVVVLGMASYRIAGGRIAESWVVWDNALLLLQLETVPVGAGDGSPALAA